jgi:predicted nucleotide-binding protein
LLNFVSTTEFQQRYAAFSTHARTPNSIIAPDIQGLIYIPFKDNLPKDAGLLLAKEMAAQGYQIDIGKL